MSKLRRPTLLSAAIAALVATASCAGGDRAFVGSAAGHNPRKSPGNSPLTGPGATELIERVRRDHHLRQRFPEPRDPRRRGW